MSKICNWETVPVSIRKQTKNDIRKNPTRKVSQAFFQVKLKEINAENSRTSSSCNWTRHFVNAGFSSSPKGKGKTYDGISEKWRLRNFISGRHFHASFPGRETSLQTKGECLFAFFASPEHTVRTKRFFRTGRYCVVCF